MTLTKDDLKAISTVVQTQIDESLVRELTPIKKDVTSIKRKLNRTARDVNYISGKFDEEIVHTRRRVEKIEDYLHLDNN
jgi:hypothetical protein